MRENTRKEGDYIISEDALGTSYKHPSFGMLSFNRTHGGHSNLFGSSIQHNDTIHMVLREGVVTRGLNDDWYVGEDEILEVEMSQSQFAELITSMNVGTGTPCTIKYLRGKGRINEADFINKRQQITNEFKECMNERMSDAKEFYDEVKELFITKKSIGKGDREMILRRLANVTQGMESSSKFIFDQFQNQIDKTITEAKEEIEAFAQNKINAIAQQALVEQKEDIVKLENPVDVNHMELDEE
jgi:hypothetical protein